jgi:hypothetical protein
MSCVFNLNNFLDNPHYRFTVKVKLSIHLIKNHAINLYGGTEEWIHYSVAQLNSLTILPQGKTVLSLQCKGGWMATTASVDVMKRRTLPLPEIEPRLLTHPSHNLVAAPTVLPWLHRLAVPELIETNMSLLYIHFIQGKHTSLTN